MFVFRPLLALCVAALVGASAPTRPPAVTTTMPSSRLAPQRHANQTAGKFVNANAPFASPTRTTVASVPAVVPIVNDGAADGPDGEISVNTLLETADEPAVVPVPELYQGPHYELDWSFTDKDSIRVTFDLFSVPTSLIENNIYSDAGQRKYSLLALMASMPSRPLKSILSLKYYVFIIRPYNKNREIILKMEKLHVKRTTESPHPHFSNALLLTALDQHEKYSVCISYYQTNASTKVPDLLLCQDIINDYGKFAELRTDPKHGLLFIATQYSIIVALLIVLQGVFTMRKRRFTQTLAKHVSTTAQSIRSTLSSVSLVRQSFSSLDAAAEQQAHHHHHHHAAAVHLEPTIQEETKLKKRIISSPAIVLSEPSVSIDNDAADADEDEPFLKRVSSKNHVHFLLGPGEEEDDGSHDDAHAAASSQEPYSEQSDALLSMAHILDTNKPWSRHGQHTSPV